MEYQSIFDLHFLMIKGTGHSSYGQWPFSMPVGTSSLKTVCSPHQPIYWAVYFGTFLSYLYILSCQIIATKDFLPHGTLHLVVYCTEIFLVPCSICKFLVLLPSYWCPSQKVLLPMPISWSVLLQRIESFRSYTKVFDLLRIYFRQDKK